MSARSPRSRLSGGSAPWLIASSIIFVFALIAAFQYVTLPKRAQENLVLALESKGTAIARIVADTIAPAVDFDDQPFIDEVFRGALKDPTVVEVHLRRLVPAEAPLSELLEGTDDAPAAPAPEVPCGSTGASMLVSSPVEVAERTVGTLHVHLSTRQIERQHQNNTFVAGGIAALLMLVGFATAALASMFVRRAQHVAQLASARDRAEAVVRAKDEFMAAMSHEVRSPLNAVLGMAQNLADTDLSDRQQEFCRTIVRSGRGLVDLINRQLDLAKLDAERLVLAPAKFDLREFVEESVMDFSALAQRKGVDVSAEVSATVPGVVSADRMRLGQMLGNLLGNAVKFTESGHIGVRVSAEPAQGDRLTLKVAVTDTGIGVDPEGAKRLFEPFAQANAEIAGSFGGTGLGLSLVKQLADLMGGTAAVESEPGQGSTFWFTATVEPLAPPAPCSVGRVLFVSDRAWRRSALSAAFESCGVDALVVDSLAAVEANQLSAFALVLADAENVDTPAQLGQLRALAGGARARVFTRLDGQPGAVDFEADIELVDWPAATSRLLDTTPSRSRPRSRARADTGPVPVIGGSVLLVDDDPVNQQVATIMMDSMGVKATVASGGAQAVRIFDGTYDCVLMDMQMPGMSGLEAATQIRELEDDRGWDRTPIYACSAAPAEPSRLFAAGIDGELPKPLLKAAVQRVLEDAGALSTAFALPTGEPQALTKPAEIVDVEIATMLAGVIEQDGTPLLPVLIDKYQLRMTAGLDDLRHAIRSGDLGRARAVAHAIKGTSLQLGARAIADELAATERALQDDGEELDETVLAVVEELLAPTLEALRACG